VKKLPNDFYRQEDVLKISKELLGKSLITKIDGKLTGGIITETEAYEGITDKASHAYGDRRTKRTEIMYANGGVSYVYLCYGIHHLFNVVTHIKDVPHAVLIRSILPTIGLPFMIERRNKKNYYTGITTGPGTVTQALGISTSHSGIDLNGNTIWISDEGIETPNIETGPRIGIAYAQEDALLPYRFQINLKDELHPSNFKKR